ncbi:hypothetical protein QTP86_022944 [Hemibagrus guttatus]|nr:hypothetical protein QTP86_022944 [Hemibagrus guttatus]
MCSTNHPANWVTFEDEGTPLSSPQKSLQSPSNSGSIPRPNGLKLVLPPLGSSARRLSSPLESPQMPFSFNGSSCVPSNTPMCTPVRETPTGPSPFNYDSLRPPSVFRSFSNTSTNLSSPDRRSSSEVSTSFPAFQDQDLGHVELFLGENKHKTDSGSSSSDSEPGSSLPRFFIRTKDGYEPPRDQLQNSYSYICHKLERLKAKEGQDQESDERDLDTSKLKDIDAGRSPSSFVPQGLFLSQRRHGWPLMLRIPEKKNRMSSRQWGPIYLQLLPGAVLQMYYEKGLEKPFKEFQLSSSCYLSGPKLESYGEPRKIATLKIEHLSYVEKKRYHPKPEVIHEAEVEQLLKFGTTEYRDMEDLLVSLEEELMRLPGPLKQPKLYEEQELSLQIADHIWMRVDKDGATLERAAITRLHCLAFVNGAVECFLALNDLGLLNKDSNYGSEEDEVWMEIADYQFHKSVREAEFEDTRLIKFSPPDGCRVELGRYRTVSMNCGDLPFSVKATVTVQGAYLELQAFLNVQSSFPSLGAHSEMLCENVMIQVPLPGDWVKVPRTISLLWQKSIKARMNRNACLGSVNITDSHPVMQVTVGTVKYENVYGAIVWRIDKLPTKNTAADHPHCFSCKLELASDQDIPTDWFPFITMECEVADTVASQTRVKSLGTESDIQPQKQISYRAFYRWQPKLYLSIIDDVIESVREVFTDEGVEERVIDELRQLWESKVLQSKAVDGFAKENINPSNFVLQLPANYSQTIQKSTTASGVLPARQQSFTGKASNTGTIATFSLPPGVTYPVQIPAGVTLQTASGHFYKVNVPVMVTQAPGCQRIPPQANPPHVEQRNLPSGVIHNLPASQVPPPPTQSIPAPQAPKPLIPQQHPVLQVPLDPPVQAQVSPEPSESPLGNLDEFTLDGIDFSPQPLDMSTPSCLSAEQMVERAVKVAAAARINVEDTLSHFLPDLEGTPDGALKLDMDLLRDYNFNELTDIPQLDGACDSSSEAGDDQEEEKEDRGPVGENEFLGMINAEALQALQGLGGSSDGNGSSSSDGDEPELEMEEEEEDPLNSGDDVSEQDIPEIFDTENVIVCQYDKIHRSKNRWKFYLKDGVMCYGGKDYVFSKAVGEAEW